MQILRLTTPKLKNVWGPVLHSSDVDLSLGAPFAQNDIAVGGRWVGWGGRGARGVGHFDNCHSGL